MSGSAGGTRTAIEDCRGQKDMFKAVGGGSRKGTNDALSVPMRNTAKLSISSRDMNTHGDERDC